MMILKSFEDTLQGLAGQEEGLVRVRVSDGQVKVCNDGSNGMHEVMRHQ